MALGDGIGRNKGDKGYAYTKGYNQAIEDFLKESEKVLTDLILQHQGQLNFASGLAVANRTLDDVADKLRK